MNMYTVPEWRGKGVATALLQEILQFVKTRNIPRVWLHTTLDGKHLSAENGFTATQDDMEWLWQKEIEPSYHTKMKTMHLKPSMLKLC
jgi:GNAT superfamily N-acetyltransferase